MRAYLFKFIGRAENEYLIDLDKLVSIGQPFFDTDNGIAYVTLTFQGVHSVLNTRFLTDYACIDSSVSTNDETPMSERKAIMKKTWENFLITVEELKSSWIAK